MESSLDNLINIHSANELDELQCFVFASIISADNDKYDEAVKQRVIERYNKYRSNSNSSRDWEYILEPLGKDAETYIKLLAEE